MNREIKFRSYSGEPGTATMKYNVGVHPFMAFRLSNYCIDEQKYDDQTGDLVMTPALTNLMQYTRFLDKNKKHIYEGDIVIDADGCKYTIEYTDFCAFFLFPIEDRTKFMAFYPGLELDVVGNIFENPELLK